MEYLAMYKCRLCGQKFSMTRTGNEDIVTKNVIELTSLGYSVGAMMPSMTTTHLCQNGSWGIADFQGWEKVD